MSARSGFSLLEVLVAVFVFAIAGLIATGLLNASLTAQDINRQSAERAEMIDRARLLMREDIGQLVNRTARQADGRSGEYAFAGSVSGLASMTASGRETVLMAFTRRGRPNPGYVQARGTLQYVEYVREDDRLIRRSWAYPDRAFDTPVQEFVLLDGLEELELSFLAVNSWTSSMMAGRTGGQALPLPRAVRLTAQSAETGAIEFVFLTPEFPS